MPQLQCVGVQSARIGEVTLKNPDHNVLLREGCGPSKDSNAGYYALSAMNKLSPFAQTWKISRLPLP